MEPVLIISVFLSMSRALKMWFKNYMNDLLNKKS